MQIIRANQCTKSYGHSRTNQD